MMHSDSSTIDHPKAGKKEVQACTSNRRPAMLELVERVT